MYLFGTIFETGRTEFIGTFIAKYLQIFLKNILKEVFVITDLGACLAKRDIYQGTDNI